MASREDQISKLSMKKACYSSLIAGLCAVGLFTGGLSMAQADTIAFSPTLSLNGSGVGNDGFFFTPATAISVTSLGYVDCGFSVGHDVGLYDVRPPLCLRALRSLASRPWTAVSITT